MAYACLGIFSALFSLISLVVKERLYIGEATVATIAGLILGPHCLNWFVPTSWGNTDHLTLELSRIVLCIQIVAVAVELPRKYMKRHWISVTIMLLPVMTCGWLVVGLFIWVLIPNFNFSSGLLVAACVTATDPVLAAAVVGKGKFAERVPGHLRNLLTAESGCNDGMAFPFIYLALNLIVHDKHPAEIVKDWFTLTILWECFFGVILGVCLGFLLRKAIAFASRKSLIDQESFLAFFVFLAFTCAGIGSMLGVDDLLVSFAAGAAFGWNGDFAKKTEESHVSTVIDLIINLAFFVYLGAIIPWADFNNSALGLDVWRLVVLAVVVIFLRRIPAVLAFKPFTPDIKSWREALFCGHFGPIGVGAIFAAILARADLEKHYVEGEETPLAHLPSESTPHYQLIATIWPIVCFIVITSIVVHGSTVAVLALGRRLNRMAITMSFTVTNTQEQGPTWMSRLQKLEKTSSSYSLQRIDTTAPSEDELHMPRTNTVETSGIKVRPAGGAKRKRHKRKSMLQKSLSRPEGDIGRSATTDRQRPQAQFLQLGGPTKSDQTELPELPETSTATASDEVKIDNAPPSLSVADMETLKQHIRDDHPDKFQDGSDDEGRVPTNIYQEGHRIVVEDQHGEVVETLPIDEMNLPSTSNNDELMHQLSNDSMSIHSMDSLRRHMSNFSIVSGAESSISVGAESLHKKLSPSTAQSPKRKTIVKKSEKGSGKRFYAHKIDNLIVIENDEGEIVRRYRVSKHHSNSTSSHKTRPRQGSLVNRAMSKLGLAKNSNVTATESEQAESQQPPGPAIARKSSPSPAIPESDEYDDDSEADEDESDVDLPAETEVEKKRRLEALGHLPARRDADDEED